MKGTYLGQVRYSAPISEGIILLKISLLEPKVVDFKAGQYLAVLLPESGKQAYYSIASSPNKKNEVELLVKEDKLGAGSSYLFSLSVGDSIELMMPMGEAFIRDKSQRDAVFVGGASGASYARSMIHYLDESGQLEHRRVHYFLGVREAAELMELEYMYQLTEKHATFHFYPVVSDPKCWNGYTGPITGVVDTVLPNDLSEWEAYAAGSPEMVKALATLLISKKGLTAERFFSDLYTPEDSES
ncbi:MAG: NADH:ubiquinone oxidoreductase, na translocating, f subunit [Cycloclasticus sp. symbiont of Poecilosclerida sp. N]|nr:MAG: NADH:ubiquinone oxidoreductase, na translocating, f subunit [Cycloclasticus sp. symbiont of Poecilosclerida sp. N]